MKTYKFRAECLQDIIKLMEQVPLKLKIEKQYLPDCTAEIVTDLSLTELKNIISLIPDSHVMLETIAPYSEYTGKRL